MGNAIRFLKARIGKVSLTLSESEAKAALCSDIERFMNEKIVLADRVITRQAVMKIRDGDILLTYGSSSVVEMILLHAYELGRQFRVIVVDSRPKFEGRALLRRLVKKGLCCTYTHINAVSYVCMKSLECSWVLNLYYLMELCTLELGLHVLLWLLMHSVFLW